MTINPTRADLRGVDPVVRQLFGGLLNIDTQFIADMVAPPVEVEETTGTLYTLDGMFGDPTHDLRRAPGSGYHLNKGFGTSTSTYVCERIGDEAIIDNDDLQDNQIPADLEALHLVNLWHNIMIRKERDVANVLFTASNWTNSTTLSGANQWSDPNSDPVGDIITAINTLRQYGRRANTIVFGAEAWNTFSQNAAVLNFLSANSDRNLMTRDEGSSWFSEKFGLRRFFIGDAVYNTAAPGLTQSLSDIWGDNVWIGYIDDGAGAVVRGGNVTLRPSAVAHFIRDPLVREENEDFDNDGRKLRLKYKQYVGAFQADLGYQISDVSA